MYDIHANTNLIVMTGWHTLDSTSDLKPWFFGEGCEPLDAPEHIATGSTFKGCYGSILSSSVPREWLYF